MTSDHAPLLRVRGLTKHFPVFSKGFFRKQVGTVRAVDDIDFDLHPGETLGLVGESGSGKTTAVRTILRALAPTAGSAVFQSDAGEVDLATIEERDLKPLRREMQMIFQDPFSSINPRMTVGRIVGEPLVIHGLAEGDKLRERVSEMLVRVGLKSEHMVRYPHAFSGGQRQRIGIARALILRPKLVVADEAVSALDVSVQAQVINLLGDLQSEFRLAYIFVAHDLSVVKHICDRVAVMYAGKIVEIATVTELFSSPLHPYTRALLSAVPNPDPEIKLDFTLGGDVADPANLPSGCSFHPRCPDAQERCSVEKPVMRDCCGAGTSASDAKTRRVACHFAGIEAKVD
jgi:oligopeptide/dipeptide ABC transporter ATP-binding protein